MSVLELLACILIVLKAAGQTALSWFWVLAPIWIPIAILLAVCVLVILVNIVAKITK